METFKKRQKEMLRMERQRDKAAKRLARKQQRLNPTDIPADASEETVSPEEAASDNAGQSSS